MKLFGSKKREIWQRLSTELGGAMHSSWRGDKVQVAHEDWIITLDEEPKWSKLWSDLFLRGQAVVRERD